MKTLRAGLMTLDQIKAYTLAIARGEHKPKADEPRVWFTSMKSFAEVLSDENRELLRIIFDRKPESLSELERLTGRRAAAVRGPRMNSGRRREKTLHGLLRSIAWNCLTASTTRCSQKHFWRPSQAPLTIMAAH